jgi:hypothetical protein
MKIVSTDSIIPGGRYHNRRIIWISQIWVEVFVVQNESSITDSRFKFGRWSVTKKISDKDYQSTLHINPFLISLVF